MRPLDRQQQQKKKNMKVNCKSLDDYLEQVFPVIVIAKIVQRIAGRVQTFQHCCAA